MTKRRTNIHPLQNDEQRQALGQYQKDLQHAMPHMMAMAQAAKELHQAMIDAPMWSIAETAKPDNVEDIQDWTVGHAEVNYVEHIEHEGTQQK